MNLKTTMDLIENPDELLEPFGNINPHITELVSDCINILKDWKLSKFQCSNNQLATFLNKIDYVLFYIHDFLNIGKWDQVPDHYRVAYTVASFVKATFQVSFNHSIESLRLSLQTIDKGFLLGLPHNAYPNLLTQYASILTKQLMKMQESDDNLSQHNTNKRLKTSTNEPTDMNIEALTCPTIETFQCKYFDPQKPLVIRGCMTHWPAMHKWTDMNYLLAIAGERTVPVEFGSSYSSENFSQKLITIREFINNYILNEPKEIGYLAQHDLLSQVPELSMDIKLPEFCCLSRNLNENINDEEPEINVWFGPKGTISSLHFDPKDNLLCQVAGSKQIILFAPSDSSYLYPFSDNMLQNTSQVDPISPNLELHGNFSKATMFKCTISCGDMLYIPPKWWHHVTALEQSFSVNFWWK